MRHRSTFRSRRSRGKRAGALAGTLGVVVALAALFAYGIWWFRFGRSPEPELVAKDTLMSATVPSSPISVAALAASARASGSVDLRDVSGGTSSATAVRRADEDAFEFSIKAQLPEINRDAYAYEAWLLRQVPYDYFSVGTFETNDDGAWVLEWSGAPGKYDAYTHVVVTLEAKDGNPDPSGHVLEGEFE